MDRIDGTAREDIDIGGFFKQDRSAVILKRDRLQSAAPNTLVAVLTIICLAYQASFHNIPP